MALVPLLTRIGRTHDVMIWLVARSLLLLPMTQKKKTVWFRTNSEINLI
jgi:hypothetical protein